MSFFAREMTSTIFSSFFDTAKQLLGLAYLLKDKKKKTFFQHNRCVCDQQLIECVTKIDAILKKSPG